MEKRNVDFKNSPFRWSERTGKKYYLLCYWYDDPELPTGRTYEIYTSENDAHNQLKDLTMAETSCHGWVDLVYEYKWHEFCQMDIPKN